MQFSQKRNLRSGCSAVKFYTPPKLHTGKEWYVDFYASDLMSRIFTITKTKRDKSKNEMR